MHACMKQHLSGGSRGGAAGARPPTGPDSFVLTYKFFEMQPSRELAPPYEVGAPPKGNPGSATASKNIFSWYLLINQPNTFVHLLFANINSQCLKLKFISFRPLSLDVTLSKCDLAFSRTLPYEFVMWLLLLSSNFHNKEENNIVY